MCLPLIACCLGRANLLVSWQIGYIACRVGDATHPGPNRRLRHKSAPPLQSVRSSPDTCLQSTSTESVPTLIDTPLSSVHPQATAPDSLSSDALASHEGVPRSSQPRQVADALDDAEEYPSVQEYKAVLKDGTPLTVRAGWVKSTKSWRWIGGPRKWKWTRDSRHGCRVCFELWLARYGAQLRPDSLEELRSHLASMPDDSTWNPPPSMSRRHSRVQKNVSVPMGEEGNTGLSVSHLVPPEVSLSGDCAQKLLRVDHSGDCAPETIADIHVRHCRQYHSLVVAGG